MPAADPNPKVKIVVWDSIGNTLLGVRPWASWDDDVRAALLAENPQGAAAAPPLREILAGYDVDLLWFNSADAPYAPFGQLYADYAEGLRFTRDVGEVVAAVEDADFLVVHKEKLPAAAIERARNLKLIQHLGQDARGIPVAAARARGIPVAATPLVNYLTVAETVWAYILNWAKRLPSLRTHIEGRAYPESWHLYPGTRYLPDLTLGLVGLGEIARPVAKVAQAFGMPTIYWARERQPDAEGALGIRYADRDEVWGTSDVVALMLALNPETEGIVGAREFALMKPGSLFVNIARGKLVDQAALTAAVAAGRIDAALDVFADEPLAPDDPLVALHDNAAEHLTLTPHNAWGSPWTWVRDSQELWFNVRRALAGEAIRHKV
jgi:phosphoglycerate dehydrogenase-like enzyme